MERIPAVYQNECDRFRLPIKPNYEHQYCDIYRKRLLTLRPILTEISKRKWGEDIPIRKTSELRMREESVVIGIAVKQQQLRPGIVKMLAKQTNELPQPLYQKYTKEEDSVDLEDDMQVIHLTGDVVLQQALVTGVLLAARGREVKGDVFQVKEFAFPDLGPQPPLPEIQDKYVLFVSGLEMRGREADEAAGLMSERLLADWLCGAGGDTEERRRFASKVVRVIIAGNSIAVSHQEKNFSEVVRKLTRKMKTPGVDAMRNLDSYLARLTTSVPVDVMPGEFDPANYMMPQQPLHSVMFPLTAAQSSRRNLTRATNPYRSQIDGRTLLGTSGQNLDDLYRFSVQDRPLELLRMTFDWQHLIPTAPDTLASFPFYDSDPFILSQKEEDRCPDIFFAGNQGLVASWRLLEREGRRTLLLTLPVFASSGAAVLVNLRDLTPQTISFGKTTFDNWD